MALNDINENIFEIQSLLSLLRFLDLSSCDDKLSLGLIVLIIEIEDKLKAVEEFLVSSPTTNN